MIYSKWRPDRGGYDYFEVPQERRGLGDDLPTPVLHAGKLGVASTSAGRPIPSGARRVGSGAIAKGVVAPLDRSGLSMAGISFSLGSLGTLVVGALLGYWYARRKR